jgi:glycosyltransferase involved in cell wall biosynthesis
MFDAWPIHATCSRALHIVVLNHRDLTHPEAGGAEVYLHEIFQRIAAAGHRVTLLCARYTAAPRTDRHGGITVVRVGTQATMHVVGTFAALQLARRERVDVFVESLCKVPFFVPAFTNTPVLPLVLHLFGAAAFRELNPALASYVWLSEKLIPPVYRRLPFVALSESTARDLRRRGITTARIDVVPPGLDLARYPAGPCSGAKEPLLVYVGRLKRYKGLDIVLRAFAQTRTKVPAARLTLVGKGDDRPRLERLVSSLGLGDAVHFAGYVSEDSKIDWLRRACAVVYPSPKEGWGIATLEAAACGRPVLASDADGLRDAVQDGVTGLLIPHSDLVRWTAGMTQVLLDASLRRRLGAAARLRAGEFDWDAQATKIRLILESITRTPRMTRQAA